MNIGPMQLIFTAFEGDALESGVVDEIFAATGNAVRLLDLLALEKDEEGNLWMADLNEETETGEIVYGKILGQVIATGANEPVASRSYDEDIARFVVGVSPGEVNDLAHSLPTGHSAVVALLEHVWAAGLHQSVLESGGVLLAQALVQPEALAGMDAELSAAILQATATEGDSMADEQG